MTQIIHTNPEKKAMDIFKDDQLQTLEKAIQTIDRHVYISKVDYDKGLVYIGMNYNEGTPNFFQEEDFMTINVGSDSIPAAFKDVFNRVYDRCM